MDEETVDREVALNRQFYERRREQIGREYAGQYIALGEGRILAAGPDFDEVDEEIIRLFEGEESEP